MTQNSEIPRLSSERGEQSSRGGILVLRQPSLPAKMLCRQDVGRRGTGWQHCFKLCRAGLFLSQCCIFKFIFIQKSRNTFFSPLNRWSDTKQDQMFSFGSRSWRFKANVSPRFHLSINLEVSKEEKLEVRKRIWFHWDHAESWKFNSA